VCLPAGVARAVELEEDLFENLIKARASIRNGGCMGTHSLRSTDNLKFIRLGLRKQADVAYMCWKQGWAAHLGCQHSVLVAEVSSAQGNGKMSHALIYLEASEWMAASSKDRVYIMFLYPLTPRNIECVLRGLRTFDRHHYRCHAN
jgi:hypothetical protein